MARKKYVLVGAGGRARFFYGAIIKDFKDTAELIAFCDINQTRMDYANSLIVNEYGGSPVRTYKCEEFDRMIQVEKLTM